MKVKVDKNSILWEKLNAREVEELYEYINPCGGCHYIYDYEECSECYKLARLEIILYKLGIEEEKAINSEIAEHMQIIER